MASDFATYLIRSALAPLPGRWPQQTIRAVRLLLLHSSLPYKAAEDVSNRTSRSDGLCQFVYRSLQLTPFQSLSAQSLENQIRCRHVFLRSARESIHATLDSDDFSFCAQHFQELRERLWVDAGLLHQHLKGHATFCECCHNLFAVRDVWGLLARKCVSAKKFCA
jgi:hypothetical protein